MYVRSACQKDIALCLCKIHLQACRGVDTLVKLCIDQNITLDFDSYGSFFEVLQKDCPDSPNNVHVSWQCSPNKHTLCEHQQNQWDAIKYSLSKSDDKVKRTFQYFETTNVDKHGEIKKQLSVKSEQVNVKFIVEFIEKILPNIVHHRNLLLNFRTEYPRVLESLSTVEIHVDFSENLTLTLPEEIQSMYWGQAKTQVTLHSGILKFQGNKSYHLYISNDLTHDQAFVYLVLNQMLSDIEIAPGTTVIVTCDNCTG